MALRWAWPEHLVAVGEGSPARIEIQWYAASCTVTGVFDEPVRMVAVGRLPGERVRFTPDGCVLGGPWQAIADDRGIATARAGWLAPDDGCELAVGEDRVFVRAGQPDVVIGPGSVRRPRPALPRPSLRLGPDAVPAVTGPPITVAFPADAYAVTVAGCGVGPLWDPRVDAWFAAGSSFAGDVGTALLASPFTPTDGEHWAQVGPFTPDATTHPWSFPEGCSARLIALGDDGVRIGPPTAVRSGGTTFEVGDAAPWSFAEAHELLCAAPEDEPACELVRLHRMFPPGNPAPPR